MSYISGIFSSTFLQPVNGCKNSILNWVLKLGHFICSKSLKCFYFIHLFTFLTPAVVENQFSSDHLETLISKILTEIIETKSTKSLKLNPWRKTAVDKSSWIKACIVFYQKFYMIKWTKGFFISCDDVVSEEFRVIFNFIFIFALHKKWSFYVKTS